MIDKLVSLERFAAKTRSHEGIFVIFSSCPGAFAAKLFFCLTFFFILYSDLSFSPSLRLSLFTLGCHGPSGPLEFCTVAVRSKFLCASLRLRNSAVIFFSYYSGKNRNHRLTQIKSQISTEETLNLCRSVFSFHNLCKSVFK